MKRNAKKHPPPTRSVAQGRRIASTLSARLNLTSFTVCAMLALAVALVFCQTAGHDFLNFDDDVYVTANEHVKHGLTAANLAWAATACYASNWHPLTWLSHMLDYEMYGLNPAGHHSTGVVLHAATAIALFLTLRRMTGALWPSAWVAAVFAVHPLRVESVAWLSERKDVLSGLLSVLVLWLYARYAERPGWGRYLCLVGAFALGLAAKPMLVTLPFVLLLLDYWPLRRVGRVRGAKPKFDGALRTEGETALYGTLAFGRFRAAHRSAEASVLHAPYAEIFRLIVEKLPLLALAAVSCGLTIAAHASAMKSYDHLTLAARAANAARACVAYIGKMFCPVGLAVLYPLSKTAPPLGTTLIAAGLLLAITVAAIALRRSCPYLFVGWFWYIGMLVPVIGLVQVGDQAMADRYTYLTQIGLSIAVAWAAAGIARSRLAWRRGFAVAFALVLAVLMAAAWRQTQHWRDSVALWARTVACTGENLDARVNFANALAQRGRAPEAIAQLEKALEIAPDNPLVHNNLGVRLAKNGQDDKAIEHYRRALQLKPEYMEAHNNLGNALYRQEKFGEAVEEYREALHLAVASNMNGLCTEIRDHIRRAQSAATSGGR